MTMPLLPKRTLLIIHPKTLHFLSSISTSSQPPFHHNHHDESSVTIAVSILKHHRSKSRWTQLRSLFPSGFSPSQFSQIIIQLRNNPHLSFRFFLFTLRHSLCHHSPLSYATIIHTLARSRQKSRALALIQSAIRKFPDDNNPNLHSKTTPLIFETLVKTYRTCDSAPFVFDLLIKACLRSKKIDQAIEIMRMLRSKGILPLVNTCNSLIMSVSRTHGSIAGYEVYNEVFGLDGETRNKNGVGKVTPNVDTYNMIMLGFYRDGLIEILQQVWSDMIIKNCVPNAYSYSILMAAYCGSGRIDQALRLWEEMGDKGLKHETLAYNTMIGGFCEVGDVCRAEELYREMGLSGLESTCVTYEHLINGYCKIGDVDSALMLYKDMWRKDFVPERCTVDLVIKVLCEKNRVSEAMEILRVTMKRNDVTVKSESYELLIKGLCHEGRMGEGIKLQAEMVGKGYKLNADIYTAFIDGYEKQGNRELADRLRKEVVVMEYHLE